MTENKSRPDSQPDPLQLHPRPTSTAAHGMAGQEPTAGAPRRVRALRSLRVQLEGIDGSGWAELRQLATEGARFNNALIGAWYAEALGAPAPDVSPFRSAAGRLSGDVRVALRSEALTQWRRHKRRVLAGAQRVPFFEADRALVCRGEHMDRGRRRRHAILTRDAQDVYWLALRLRSVRAGDAHRFRLWWRPDLDDYLGPVIEGLARGETRLLKVAVIFDRPGQKVYALLSYEIERDVPPSGARRATLGPIEPDGALWLRVEGADGHLVTINNTGAISKLLSMRTHFDGILQRLRRHLRRSGRGHRAAYRRQLVRAGSFDAWSEGPLHMMARQIIDVCARHGVGTLTVAGLLHQGLPMYRLITRLTEKGSLAGVAVSETVDPANPTTYRAIVQPVARRGRNIGARRRALSVLKEAVSETAARVKGAAE